MSQQPVWITESGSLGTVPEEVYYRLALLAVDPDFPNDPEQLTYSLIAGNLPSGIAITPRGVIEGIPLTSIDVKGVPTEVSRNVTSKFTIRATSQSDRIVDRTFTLTIVGQDPPEFVASPGLVGVFFDGDQVNYQFEVIDLDTNDITVIELMDGELPSGLELSSDGWLTGYIEPNLIDTNFEFTLQVSDGKDVNLRVFNIYVASRDALTADSTLYTADNGFITIDTSSTRIPFLEEIPVFENIRHDNFYAYQFLGVDPNGGDVTYNVIHGSLPTGLTLDVNTGWLQGDIPFISQAEINYNFTIQLAVAADPGVVSESYNFNFNIVGNIETDADWITPTELGWIEPGEISTFYIEAAYNQSPLTYRLKPGEYSKLPQGLILQSNGDITGRVSFKTFSLDNNSTTFDVTRTLYTDDLLETTFDHIFIFNAEAYTFNGAVSITKEFIIKLTNNDTLPYNILYAKALPPEGDREIVNELLLDSSIMTPDVIYRSGDPNFGVARDVVYQHAYGLNPKSLDEYFASFELNHYKKQITLGEIKTAIALDDNEEILYEVVYSTVIDDMVNDKGVSVSKEIDLYANAINHGDGGVISDVVNTVYPNSFENMRNQVISQIGQVSKVLPRWMLSKQEDGTILGFTPAWVIAYTKPEQAELLAYRIRTQFKNDLNKVDFTLDRLTLDNHLTKDWETCKMTSITADTTEVTSDDITNTADQDVEECKGGWEDGIMTTFDRDAESVYESIDAEAGYDRNPFDFVGYDYVPPVITPKPDDPFDVDSETIFDNGSCRFIHPVDTYRYNDESYDTYNKYIMFPQVDITNSIPINTENGFEV